MQASMAQFKQYLETRGASLAKSGEFLAFYALPYIPAPERHPSFEQLFTMDWVTQQRMTLEKYLQGVPTEQPLPKLHAMLELYTHKHELTTGSGRLMASLRIGHSPQSSLPPVEEMDDVADDGEAGEETEVDMRAVEEPYLGPSGAASPTKLADVEPGHDLESTSMLALSTGQGSRSDLSLEVSAAEPAVGSTGGSHVKEAGRPESPMKSTRSHSMFQQAVLPALNYERLKRDLLEGEEPLVARLLQALRWRLVKTPPGPDRQRVLATFIEWDVLLGQNPTERGSVIQACCRCESGEVRVELVRLLNCIASHRAGRSYLLLPGACVIQELVALLKGDPGAMLQSVRAGDTTMDTPQQQQALATLQKLSLHRAAQAALLRLDVLEWLAAWLGGYNRLSDHSIEYGLALLMNLCLRPEGRARAEQTELLALLENFVEIESIRVRTYVNGALYSLLQRPRLRQVAQERGLEDLLRAVAQNSSEMLAKQIKYILTQLHCTDTEASPGGPGSVDSSMSTQGRAGDEEEAWEGDDVEEEAEEQVALNEANPGDLQGEQLLCGQYLASVEAAQSEISMLRSSIVLKDLHQPMDSIWGRASLKDIYRRPSLRLGPLAEVPLQRPITPNLTPTEHPLTELSESIRRKGKSSLRSSLDASLREGSGFSSRHKPPSK